MFFLSVHFHFYLFKILALCSLASSFGAANRKTAKGALNLISPSMTYLSRTRRRRRWMKDILVPSYIDKSSANHRNRHFRLAALDDSTLASVVLFTSLSCVVRRASSQSKVACVVLSSPVAHHHFHICFKATLLFALLSNAKHAFGAFSRLFVGHPRQT
jgi:hypothetical protein